VIENFSYAFAASAFGNHFTQRFFGEGIKDWRNTPWHSTVDWADYASAALAAVTTQ
jgi:hypothetical protein